MTSAKKFDEQKVRMELVPPVFTEAVASVLTFGAKKYGDHNWALGLKYDRVIGAILRHVSAIQRGEDVDPESGEWHAAHAACNLAFLIHFMENNRTDLDDRAFKRG